MTFLTTVCPPAEACFAAIDDSTFTLRHGRRSRFWPLATCAALVCVKGAVGNQLALLLCNSRAVDDSSPVADTAAVAL